MCQAVGRIPAQFQRNRLNSAQTAQSAQFGANGAIGAFQRIPTQSAHSSPLGQSSAWPSTATEPARTGLFQSMVGKQSRSEEGQQLFCPGSSPEHAWPGRCPGGGGGAVLCQGSSPVSICYSRLVRQAGSSPACATPQCSTTCARITKAPVRLQTVMQEDGSCLVG